MKRIFKYTLILSLTAALGSCSDDEYQAGRWTAAEGYAQVSFPKYSVSEKIDPSAPRTKTFEVKRKNTTGKHTVAFEVVENTDSIFSVTEATFADGDSTATFSISFPKAELDKTYKLLLQVSDPQSASPWDSQSTLFGYEVLIEKWNSLGMGGYTEDFLTTFFNLQNLTYEVEILEKDNQPGLYRLVYPYDGKYGYNEPGDWDETTTYYLEINATDSTGVWLPMREQGLDWGYGNLTVYSKAGQALDAGRTLAYAKNEGLTGTLSKEGVITFPEKSLLLRLPKYSTNWSEGNTNGAFAVYLPEAWAAKNKD